MGVFAAFDPLNLLLTEKLRLSAHCLLEVCVVLVHLRELLVSQVLLQGLTGFGLFSFMLLNLSVFQHHVLFSWLDGLSHLHVIALFDHDR